METTITAALVEEKHKMLGLATGAWHACMSPTNPHVLQFQRTLPGHRVAVINVWVAGLHEDRVRTKVWDVTPEAWAKLNRLLSA